MKKHSLIFAALLSGALLSTVFSCKQNIVAEPTKDGNSSMSSADYGDTITVPVNVAASQGNYRSITLSWDVVKNATQYQIYSADTPFEAFEQIGETAGTETTFTLDEDTGVTKYYLIKAVNYYGTVSIGSKIVSGTTLDAPVITEITNDTEGNSVTVSWWMGNCSEDTYSSLISFVVTAYNESKVMVQGSQQTVDGNTYSCTITGLSPKTSYYFTVEAKIKDSDQKSENSGYTKAETAHRVVPDAPAELTVTKGESKDYVQISWKTPDFVEYRDKKTLIYSTHPVYFTLERKLLSEDDSAYKVLVPYLGSILDNALTAGGLSFNCADNTTSDTDKLLVEASAEGNTYFLYPEYVASSKITYTDKTAAKGVQYSYRVCSYTDDCGTEKITANDNKGSVSDSGWKLSVPVFTIDNTIDLNADESEITKINVNYKLTFEAFDIAYKYVITSQQTKFDATAIEEKVIATFDTVQAINDAIASFENPSDTEVQGSYVYKIYIVPADTADLTVVPSDYLYSVEASNKVTVTNDAHLIPTVDNLEIYDGYKDRFVLLFDKTSANTKDTDDPKDTLTYTISWTPYENNEEKAAKNFSFIYPSDPSAGNTIIYQTVPEDASAEPVIFYDKSDYTDGDFDTDFAAKKIKVLAEVAYEKALDDTAAANKIKVIHYAASGVTCKYSVKADKNGIPHTEAPDTKYQTLGTAVPVMTAPDYTTITVTWPAVQKADAAYEITADYADGTSGSVIDTVTPNTAITEENGTVTCVITKPVGYDDYTKSGLPINFTVTAKNNTTGDTTTAELTARTLGPAKINANAELVSGANKFKITWNKTEGATGYVIYRTKYYYNDDFTAWEFKNADYYYYDASSDTENGANGSISVLGQIVPSSRVSVQSTIKDGVYTIFDCDYKQEDLSPENSLRNYEERQAQISWGIPFGYVVLPVNGSADDFVFGEESEYLTVTGGDSGVCYTNAFVDKKTATNGYGLNVTAAKSESASAVKVEWKKPYQDGLIPTLYKMPYSKEENHDYTATWTLVKELAEGATYYEDVLSVDDIASAFVYAVQYAAPKISSFTESYRNNLANTKTDTEANNKGYLLTLKNFKADYGGTNTAAGNASYYQENITWDKVWDYEERAIGPDSFTIDIKNRNLASTMNWTTIASGVITDGVQAITPSTGFTDTTVATMTGGDGITIKPTGLTAGTATSTNDLLKVLRDAKHYYSVNLKRGDNDAVRQAADNTIYAYRQISPTELAKSVMLINADAFYGTTNTSMTSVWVAVYTEYTYSTNGYTGSFFWKNGYDQVSFKYDNYQHIFTTTPDGEKITSFLTLSDCNYTEVGEWNNNKNYQLRTITNTKKGTPSTSTLISISIASDIPLSSYSGTLKYASSDTKCYIKLLNSNGNDTKLLSDDVTTSVADWNPMHIAGNSYTGTTSGTYWWN